MMNDEVYLATDPGGAVGSLSPPMRDTISFGQRAAN
jgi:hypothetical protein